MYKRYVYKRGKRFGPYYYESYRDGDKIRKRYLGLQPQSSNPVIKTQETSNKTNNQYRNPRNIFQNQWLILPILFIIILIGFWLFYTNLGATGKVTLELSPSYTQGEAVSGMLKLSLKAGELIPASSTLAVNMAGDERQFPLSELLTQGVIEGSFYAENTQLTGSGAGYGIAGTKTIYPEISFKLRITKEKGREEETPAEEGPETPSEEIETPSIPLEESPQEQTPTEAPETAQPEQTPLETPIEQPKQEKEENAEKPAKEEKSEKKEEKQQEQPVPAPAQESTPSASTETPPTSSESSSTSSGESAPASSESSPSSETSATSESPITGSVIGESKKEEKMIEASVSKDKPFAYTLGQGESAEIVQGSVRTSDNKKVDESALNLQIQGTQLTILTSYSETEQGFGADFISGETAIIEISLDKFNITAQQGTLAVSLSYNNAEIIQASAEINVVQQNATEEPAGNITNITETPAENATNITQIENVTETNITINETNATLPEINITIPENITESNITNATLQNITELNITESNATELNITAKNLTLIRNIPGITINENSNFSLNLSEYFEGAVYYEALEPENISIIIDAGNALIIPEANFTGIRNASITAYKENESLREDFVINVKDINATIETIQYQAKIGEPVKWEKRIKPEKPENITIKLPPSSKNITLKKIARQKETQIEITGITGQAISGMVGAELELNKEPKFIAFFKRLFRLTGKLTGKSVEAEETKQAEQEIDVNISAEENAEYELEYYTEAPYATEENLSGYKKMVVVSGPELNYTNILTFATINEIIPAGREKAIKLYWHTTEAEAIKYGYLKENISETENKTQEGIIKVEIMPFAFDTNNNSLIDYVEWLTPHLSNQTFEIVIEISRAEHLDKDRVFISDIYNETYKLDDIWSEGIPDNDYVRVTFSQNLTSQNDITIYPRVVQGNPTIIVYEKNKSEAIAEFSGIISNKYNKVLLTSLMSSQDTFDLQVIGGSIEFDHIIDPSENQIIGINETTDYFLLWNQYNVYRVMKTGVQVNNPPNNWSQIKWCLQGTASGNTITKCVDGLSNWNWAWNTDNNTYAWLYGTNKITTALGNITIGVNYSLMDISTMIKIEIGAYNGLSADITNLNFSYEHHNITIMNDWQDDFVGGYLNNNWTEVELNKTLNTIVTDINDNTFWIFDKVKGGDIRFNWTASNAYVWLKSNGEINTPVRLIVPAGTLAQGQIKKTTFHWVDAIGVQHNWAWGLDLTTSSTMGRRSNTANDMSIAIKANSTRGSDTDPILRVQIVNTAGITSGERLGLYFTDCTGGVLKTCAGRAIGNVTDDPASKFVPVEKQNGSTTGLFRFREASHASVVGGNQHSGVVGVTEHNPPAGAWAEGNTTDAYSVANFTGSSYNAHDFSLEYYGVAPSAKKTYVFAGTYNEVKPSWSGMHGQTGAILDVLPSPWNGSAVADHGISITSNTSALVTHIFTDDNDTDSNTTISYSDNESGTYTIPSGCNQITGGYNSYTFQSGEKGHIRTCSITGLAPNTLYFFKMVHNDSDGIAGNDILIEGPYYTHQARGAVHMHADVKDANDTTTDDEGDLKEDEAASIVTALVTGDGQYTLLRKVRMQIDAWTPTAPANVTIDRIELRYQWAMNNVPETAQSLYRADPGTEPGMCTGSGGTNWTLVETLPNSVADWIAERSATMSGYTMAQLETLDLCLNNTNSGGSAASDVVAFDFITIVPVYTPASSGTGSPTATTDAATFIEETQAQLNGEVNTQGIAGKAYFEYGLNDSYGSYTPNSSGEYVYNTIASHAIEPIKYYRTASGLTSGTTYNYRVCLLAPPNASATCGANQNFTTTQAPPPNISIVYPVNNSNHSTTLVNINYTISNDFQACWYSNNSGSVNRSITCGLNITNQSFNEGRNIVVVYTNSSSNNLNYSSITFIVDTFAPNLTLVYPSNTSYGYNVTQLNYTISNDFQACWFSSNNGVNNATITCGTNITGANSSEGNNTWLVSANDSAGNVNFSRVTFVKDTTKPSISITSPANNSNFSTNNVTINYTISDTGGISSCWYTNTSGLVNYSITCGQNISRIWNEGANNVTIYVNDSVNNLNSSSVRFVVDTTAPLLSITAPSNNSNISYNTAVNYTISDAGVGVQACLWSNNSGLSNKTITCGTNITGQGWLEGINNVTIWANDSLNNLNRSDIRFIIDTIKPNISIAYPANTSYGYNVTQLNYTISTDAQTCWWSSNNGVNNATITCGANITGANSSEGNNTWLVSANDSVNNINTSRVTFVKDTISPNINITYPRNITYNTNVSWLNYTVSTEAQTCWFSSNNGATNQTITCGVNMTGVNSTQGSNTWRIYVNDSVNNINQSNVTFVVDTIFPLINITSPANASNFSYTNVVINYTISDTNLQACWYTNTSGIVNKTITCGTNLTTLIWDEGVNNITIYANDTANNVNSSSVRFTVDTITPVISLQSPKNNTNETGDNTITFIYNVSDMSNITNCSLIINYAVNQTNITITKNINQTFVQLLPNNLYNWSVNCTDALNNAGASTNFVLNVSIPPATQYCGGVYNSSMTNWNISNNVRCDNETILVNGNIIIATGGNLSLYNVTINFSMTADSSSMINKTIDGGLFIYDNDNNASTTTDASFITSNDSRFKYNFWVNGRGGNDNFTLRNSRVSDAGFGANSQGIHLYNISNVVISGNNITNGRMHGLFLEISKNNNITSNKINVSGNTGTGIDLRLGSNSNTIQGNTINTNGTSAYGILFQLNSETNNVTSNTITTTGISGFGIYFTGGSDTNNISSNTITTSGNNGTGINVASSINLIIQGNTITTNGSNSTAMLFDAGVANNITGNTMTTSGDAARGISLLVNSNANNISGNIIKTNGSTGYGIYLSSSSNNIVINNIINATGITTDGIYLFANSDTNNISYNNISNSGRNGISLELSGAATPDYNIFQENRIVYSNYSAVTIIGANISTTITGGLIANSSVAINSSIRGRNINITNVTIQNSTLFDFYITSNSSIVALNVSFNKSKINISAGSLADWSNLTIKWFLQVNVTNASFQPLNQANATAYLNRSNQSGWDIQWSELTAVTGLTAWREGTEFFENATARIYYQHNITGNSSGGALANYTGLLDLNRSFIWNLVLVEGGVSDITNPSLNITYPRNITYNINVSVLNYTVSDDTGLSRCWFSSNNGLTNLTITCGINMSGVNSTQGSNTWRLWANDTSNNLNETNVTFVVDTIAPNVNITYPRNLSYNINVSVLNYTVSTEAQSCRFSSNNGLTNLTLTCGINMSGVNSTQGSNTWRIYVNDSAGNNNESNVTFVVDTYAPNITIAYPTNNSNHSTTLVNINYSVSDAQACWWSNNSGTLNKSITCGLNITNQSFNEGRNIVVVYANDSSNNLNYSSVTFIVDTFAPNLTLVYPANTSYSYNVTQLNYTISNDFQACWFSSNNGVNNATITCGANITGANSSEGNNTWLVSANDSAGNVNFSRVTFVKDTISPNINITYPLNTTYAINVSWLNYTLSNSPQACWFSSNNGLTNQTITCGVNMTGVNSTQGTNTWRVWSNDSVNNINQSNVTFVIDTIKPLVTISNPQNITYATSSIPFNFTLNEAGTCMYSLNSGLNNITMTANASNTGFNATNASIADGGYTARAYCNDTAGNRNDSVSVAFSKDSNPPLVTIISPAERNYSTSSIEFNVSANENSTCLYSLNSGLNNVTMTRNATDTGFNATNSSIADGQYLVNYYCNDTAGNLNSTASRAFGIDTIKPSINMTYPRNITYNINVSAINYTASDTNLQSCWYSTNNGVTNTTITCGNNATGLTSSEGSNTWLVSANDSVNNINISRITFYKDTIFPNISITSPANSSNFSTNNVTINYTISDTGGISSCWYTNTSGLVNYSITCGQNISRIWNEGTNNVTIYVNDSVNNLNSSSVRFVVDTTAPLVYLRSPANSSSWTSSNTLTFVYNASDTNNASNCSLVINNAVNATSASITKDTNQSFSINLNNGNYNWSVNCTDFVNNKGASETWQLNVNFVPPAEEAAPPSAGGAGGGGAGGTPPVRKFSVDKRDIIMKLKQGTSGDELITITNDGEALLRFLISIDKLADYVLLKQDDYLFNLAPNNRKAVSLGFVIPDEIKPGVYLGRIIINADSIARVINVVLEVESKRVLFDAKVDIPARSREIEPGEKLSAQVTVFNLGELPNVNITRVYKIMDMEGNVILEKKEAIEIETQDSSMKTFDLPVLEEGTYVLAMEVLYEDSVTTSSQIFYVKAKKELEFPLKEDNLFYIIVFAVVLVFIIIMYLNYRSLARIREKLKKRVKR